MEPKESLDKLIDQSRDNLDEAVEGAKEAGQHTFAFLRKLWFWLIAGPVNLLIVAFVIAWAFPFLFVGFPPIPEELKDEPKAIVVDKDRQSAYAYENGKLKHRFVILTGRAEHETPNGRYRVTRKIKDYVSQEYDAKMPNSLFFNDERGMALHASYLVGVKWAIKELFGNTPYIGSHGCIRLTGFGSRRLFKFADVGTPVWVTSLHGGDKN